jgi:hypothetical protein
MERSLPSLSVAISIRQEEKKNEGARHYSRLAGVLGHACSSSSTSAIPFSNAASVFSGRGQPTPAASKRLQHAELRL